MKDKILEYAKALVAAVVTLVLTTLANVTDAVEANIDPVQQAVATLVAAVLVALVPNKPPAEG